MTTVTKRLSETELFTLPSLRHVKAKLHYWAATNLEHPYTIGIGYELTDDDDYTTVIITCATDDDATLCQLRW